MKTLIYIWNLYINSDFLPEGSIVILGILYLALRTKYDMYSSFMRYFQIWFLIASFVIFNILVFLPYIGSLEMGISGMILWILTSRIGVYASHKRRINWNFRDFKKRIGAKEKIFFIIYVSCVLYWACTIYRGIQRWNT